MPIIHNLYHYFQSVFKKPDNQSFLEVECPKVFHPKRFKKIKQAVRDLCLNQTDWATTLFEYPVFLKALKEIADEKSFTKKVFFYTQRYNFTIQPGEVHCIKAETSINFFQYAYGIYYTVLDVHLHKYSFFLPVLQDTASTPINTRNHLAYLEHDLREKGFILSNVSLISHARSTLDNYYFNQAQRAFSMFSLCPAPVFLKRALRDILWVASKDNEEHFTTRFKVMVAEIYLADDNGELADIPPVIFSQLLNSHHDPKATFKALKSEKQHLQSGSKRL